MESSFRANITLRPASPADMPRLMSIMFAAFHNEPYHENVDNVSVPIPTTLDTSTSNQQPSPASIPTSWPTPDQYDDAIQAAAGIRYLESWQSNLDEEELITAIDTTLNEIVGWSRWIVHGRPRPESVWNEPLPPYPSYAATLSLHQRDAIVALTQISEKKRRAMYGGRPYVDLGMLCVSPSAQSKGVGRALLEYGFRRTEQLKRALMEQEHEETKGFAGQLVLHLESTDAGLGFYKKMGVQVVDETVIRKEWYHGDKDLVYPVMQWRPR